MDHYLSGEELDADGGTRSDSPMDDWLWTAK